MIDKDCLKCGVVCTAWFPFLETADRKLRPVVIVSNDPFNSLPFTYKQMVVALITSVSPSIITDFHILVEQDSKEFVNSGLAKTSFVRLDRIFCLDERGINKIIGKFSEEFITKIRERCRNMF